MTVPCSPLVARTAARIDIPAALGDGPVRFRLAEIALEDFVLQPRSTGGTDIRCVVRHMRKHQVKRAVLVTDGFVGTPSKAHAAFLKGVHLGVAYTAGHSKKDLEPFTDHAIELGVQRQGGGQ
jgi:hypothetical protein